MLKEAWQWYRTPSSLVARKMGHLAEAIALEARALRQQSAWQTHLAHSRAAMMKCANVINDSRAVLVLGSGALHDVPIEELCAKFSRVYLADIVHLGPVSLLKEKFSNLALLECDFTGLLQPMLGLPGGVDDNAFRDWYALRAVKPVWPRELSLVISANCLSQLPVQPVEWLRRHCPRLSENGLNAFAWHLLQDHIALLKSFQVPVCLITDDEQATYDRQGNRVEHCRLIEHLQLTNQVFARWCWDIAPPGELSAGHQAVHEVAALRL